MHAGSARDTQVGHVKNFFNLIGIRDVEVIYAEGIGMGDAVKTANVAKARAQIVDLFADAKAHHTVEQIAKAA
jgi:FMN-dependent NADH-azoreductase